ncbi:DUF2934 domain-containing protein [uncultured Enterovirga sp.]|uniref:DUF2934 domain-containing protein n=1 Tax=uncultured Enterovirga sp. TaxID=2026352 RepID=UPI0035CA7CA6
MSTERNRIVRERAYALWVENGRQEGRGEEHWLQVEREIEAETAPAEAKSLRKPAKAAAAPAKPAPSEKAARATASDPKAGKPKARSGNPGIPAR